MSSRSRRPSPFLRDLAIVLVAGGSVLAWLRRASPTLYDFDGWYHIRYAAILREHGIFRTFPWWQETFLRDHWADKDFLFHVLLIPFTFGPLVPGAKAAAVLFSTAALGVFFFVAHRLRVPWALGWTAALLACSADLLYRLGFTRPGILAVTLALLGTLAIFRSRPLLAGALALVYANAHISFHLLPCIALVHDLHRERGPDGRRSFRVAGATAAGTLLGLLASPYFPNNLRLFWVQNFRVLGFAWGRSVDLGLGRELASAPAGDLLRTNAGVFLALAAGVYLLARSRRASPEALTLLLVSSGFFSLTMLSQRMVEFLAPFSLLLLAVAVRDRLVAGPVAHRGLVVGAAAALTVALFAFNARVAWRYIGGEEVADYAPVSDWMRAHVPPGETLFHTSWSDFPQLFFHNPQLHFLVGLDPTFLYATDPARWHLWDEIYRGKMEGTYEAVRDTFRARWVLVTQDDRGLQRAADRDPRFVERYRHRSIAVYELAASPAFVTRWRVHGPYPDPARRLFDVPLGVEPGAPAAGAAGGTDLSAAHGFVDLRRALALGPGDRDVCGVGEAEVAWSPRGEGTLAIATDDEFKVYLDGNLVLAHSPYREPEAPVPLASLATYRPPPLERRVRLHPAEGPHALVVKICRVGDDFGYFLHLDPAGSLGRMHALSQRPHPARAAHGGGPDAPVGARRVPRAVLRGDRPARDLDGEERLHGHLLDRQAGGPLERRRLPAGGGGVPPVPHDPADPRGHPPLVRPGDRGRGAPRDRRRQGLGGRVLQVPGGGGGSVMGTVTFNQ